MKKNPTNWADAWLFMAILYTDQYAPLTRENIEKHGDAINHAIFTEAEYSGGLLRLAEAGYINLSGDVITINQKARDLYEEANKSFKTLSPTLDFLIDKICME